MYYIFYKLPNKHHMISYKKRGVKEVEDVEKLRISGSMVREDS